MKIEHFKALSADVSPREKALIAKVKDIEYSNIVNNVLYNPMFAYGSECHEILYVRYNDGSKGIIFCSICGSTDGASVDIEEIPITINPARKEV